MHVKKGDIAIVISGDYKGKTGEIVKVLPKKDRVVIEGVNMKWKHEKPTQQSPKGERVQRPFPLHASNVLRFDPETKKGVRGRSNKES